MKRVCLIGNPNVGKSSLFNLLTKKNQHTGNWTGKTVENEYAHFWANNELWEIVDLPGTYSLIGESKEECIASNFVLENHYDVAFIVADATNLERSMNLILEVLDATKNCIVILNLMDEAKKEQIEIDTKKLSTLLKVPVIETSMKEETGMNELFTLLNNFSSSLITISHSPKITHYLDWILPKMKEANTALAFRYLREPNLILHELEEKEKTIFKFYQHYITQTEILESYHEFGKSILKETYNRKKYQEKKEDKFWNHVFGNRFLSFLTLFLLLFVLLFLTIYLSNIPSEFLFQIFQKLEPFLQNLFFFLPSFAKNTFIYGGYRTLYWVVSVMLPPMMIFFPLFSLLEDYGLLPRIAFQLDYPFSKCGSCGKQSLTMCMGLGCNAVGVTGARIMESKKMRLLAILTNVFMPCNGRFPAMISMIGMFFIKNHSFLGSIYSAFILVCIILFGIFLTFFVTYILSKCIYKKENPMFLLEMPSFRRPKIWQTIKNAWKEKAFHVLKRAMIVSFPAGIFIYLIANIMINGSSIFEILITFFNFWGPFFGVDGVILLAFLLGLPANEIVIPILLLGYTRGGMLVEYSSVASIKAILLQNHWTISTAISFLILSLCHFPCATTLLTIKKETNSLFYTVLAFLIPTFLGLFLCFLFHLWV